jgi:hypothetical protein
MSRLFEGQGAEQGGRKCTLARLQPTYCQQTHNVPDVALVFPLKSTSICVRAAGVRAYVLISVCLLSEIFFR